MNFLTNIWESLTVAVSSISGASSHSLLPFESNTSATSSIIVGGNKCCQSSAHLRHITDSIILLTLPLPPVSSCDSNIDGSAAADAQLNYEKKRRSALKSAAKTLKNKHSDHYMVYNTDEVSINAFAESNSKSSSRRLSLSIFGPPASTSSPTSSGTSSCTSSSASSATAQLSPASLLSDTLFQGNVVEFDKPCNQLPSDLYPPRLETIVVLCRSLRSWLCSHEKNVVVIAAAPKHAALVVTCCLAYCGFLQASFIDEAIKFYTREAKKLHELDSHRNNHLIPSHHHFVLEWLKLLARKGHSEMQVPASRLVKGESVLALSRHRRQSSGSNASALSSLGSAVKENNASAILNENTQKTATSDKKSGKKPLKNELDICRNEEDLQATFALLSRGEFDDEISQKEHQQQQPPARLPELQNLSESQIRLRSSPSYSSLMASGYKITLESVTLSVIPPASLANSSRPNKVKIFVMLTRGAEVVFNSIISERGPRDCLCGVPDAVFKIDKVVDGDYLLKIYQFTASGNSILCETTFHSGQISLTDTVLRVGKAFMNATSCNPLIPDNFELALSFDVQIVMPSPVSSDASLLPSSDVPTSSSSNATIDNNVSLSLTSSRDEKKLIEQRRKQEMEDEEMARLLQKEMDTEVEIERANQRNSNNNITNTEPGTSRNVNPSLPSLTNHESQLASASSANGESSSAHLEIDEELVLLLSLVANDSDGIDLAALQRFLGLESAPRRSIVSARNVSISTLPIIIFESRRHVHGSDSIEECQICRLAFETGQSLKILPCIHRYHVECIDQWLYRKAICPICHTSIDAQPDLS